MADVLDVITLAQAKSALDISNPAQDARLPAYITAVSRRLDQLCGPIVKRNVTEAFDGSCGSTALLKYRPVASITSVTDSGTLLDPSGYYVNPATGVLTKISGTMRSRWAAGFLSVSVAYVAGRFNDTASVGEPFVTAAGMLLAHLWSAEHGMAGEFGSAPDYPGMPGFFLPNVVKGLLGDEIQPLVGIA